MTAPAPLTAALAFKRAQVLATVERVEPLPALPGAFLLTTPSLPRVWELNLVLAPAGSGAETAIDLADAAEAEAGLAHRKLRFDGAAAVEPLRAAAQVRGWALDRELVMVVVAAAPPGRTPFLLADANDWPRHLYDRLGFVAVGERIGATRGAG